MAKRKSMNKRQSRYSQRSSAGSGFLNPNSELLGEEEPFWWNKLSNISKSHLAEYSASNETSKYLHTDSQNQSMGGNNQWWKVLQTMDSSGSEKRIKAAQEETQNKYFTPDTDEEETDLPLQKRKIQIRKRPNKNTSNIFKKVLDDSKSSESSQSNLLQNPITKNTNDTPPSKKSLQELDYTEESTNQNRNISSKTIDQSHISDKILKSRHNIFRTKLRKKSYNPFETLLKTNDDSDNKSGKTETSHSNSSAMSMNKNSTSKQNVLDKSKDEKSKMSSSDASVFKKPITSPKTLNYNDNDLIPQNRSNSSFSLLSSSEESTPLQLIPELIDDNSNKGASKNISTNLKESAAVEKIADSTLHSTTTSTKFRNSNLHETIESRETKNKNETSLASVKHMNTPNKSKMENSKSLRTTINASQRESADERNLSARITNKSDKFEKMSTSMTSQNFTTSSNSRSTELNIERKSIASIILSEPNIQNSTHRSFTKDNSMNIDNKSVISSENQIPAINSNNNLLHTVNAIKDTSKDETLRKNISTLEKTSIPNISDKNEENLLEPNNKTSVNDLDINTPSLKQTSLRIMDDVNDVDDEQNANHIDDPNRKTSDIINTGHQKKINEYFTLTTSKFVSPINARQSKHLQILSDTKENKEIKEVAKKQTIDISKKINTLLTTVTNPSLKKKQVMEKIAELRNMRTNKSERKKIIDKAYIVNGEVYKRPKLPRPQIWVTDRLYQFLWKMMKPKYKLLTRVHSEKFVKELSAVVSIITKTKKYEDYETLLNNLMENMATAGIIRTANDFYTFCYDYLPYDFRVKVVPMILPGKGRNIPYNPKTLNKPILKN